MLIHLVPSSSYTYEGLFPNKRSLQSIEPSSFTRHGWFRLSPEKGFAVLAASNQGGDAAAKACDEGCAAAIREFSKNGVAATKH